MLYDLVVFALASGCVIIASGATILAAALVGGGCIVFGAYLVGTGLHRGPRDSSPLHSSTRSCIQGATRAAGAPTTPEDSHP